VKSKPDPPPATHVVAVIKDPARLTRDCAVLPRRRPRGPAGRGWQSPKFVPDRPGRTHGAARCRTRAPHVTPVPVPTPPPVAPTSLQLRSPVPNIVRPCRGCEGARVSHERRSVYPLDIALHEPNIVEDIQEPDRRATRRRGRLPVLWLASGVSCVAVPPPDRHDIPEARRGVPAAPRSGRNNRTRRQRK